MSDKVDSSAVLEPAVVEDIVSDPTGNPPENTTVQEADSTTNMATPGLRKPECFSGANPEEFPSWLARFESTAQAGGWNDKRLDTLPAYLTQRAFQIYEKIQPTDRDTYAKLTAALKTKMGLGEKKMAWRVQLRQTTRSQAEGLDEYIYRLHNLAKQAYPDSTEAERESHVNEQFILGQPRDLQFDLLKGGDNTLDRNIELAKLYESASELATGKKSVNTMEADGEEKMDTNVSLNVIKSLLQELNLPTSSNSLVCYKCHRVGHISRNCTTDAISTWHPRNTNPSRLECQRCNNRGHDAVNCRTNIRKTCRACSKKGHVEEECRSRGNYQQAELAQNDAARNRWDTKNLVAPGNAGDNWS